MASSLDRNTHFIVGESTINEIPDIWLTQYANAIQANNTMTMSTIKTMTSLNHSELLNLIDKRKLK